VETLLEIFKIAVPVLVAIILAIWAERNRKKQMEESNKPRLSVSEVFLFPDRITICKGKNIRLNTEKTMEITKNNYYGKIVLKYRNKDRVLSRNRKKYLFMNLCSKGLERAELVNTVLLFDVFNIKLDFNKNDKVRYLWIEDMYSLAEKSESFKISTSVKAKFTVRNRETSLEIPAAYAFSDSRNSPINLGSICNLVKNGRKKPIDLQSKGEAGKYLRFVETAYWIRCQMYNGKKIYDYTIYMEIDKEGTLIIDDTYEGSEVYEKKAKEAKKKTGSPVSINT